MAMLRWFFHLFELGHRIWLQNFFCLFSFITLAYLCILDAVALERVWAVFRPYKFRPSKKRTYIIVISTTSACAFQSFVMTLALRNYADIMNRIVIGAVVFLSFLILMVSYPAIILRLEQSKRQVTSAGAQPGSKRTPAPKPNAQQGVTISAIEMTTNHPTPSAQLQQASQAETNLSASSRRQPRARQIHGKAKATKASANKQSLKMFGAITILFVLSFTPFMMVNTGITQDMFWLYYFYFMNHTCNPVIYYAINIKFRKDVNELALVFAGRS